MDINKFVLFWCDGKAYSTYSILVNGFISFMSLKEYLDDFPWWLQQLNIEIFQFNP